MPAVGCNHPRHVCTISPFSGGQKGWRGGFADWAFKALEVYSIGSKISFCASSGGNVANVWLQSSWIPPWVRVLHGPNIIGAQVLPILGSREFLLLYREAMRQQCWEQLPRTLVWMFYLCTSDSNNDNLLVLTFFLFCYWVCYLVQ